MKVGDKVEYASDPCYFGVIVGKRVGKSDAGWWVHDATGKSRGEAVHNTLAAGSPNQVYLTAEVEMACRGKPGRMWRSREAGLRLVTCNAPAPAAAPAPVALEAPKVEVEKHIPGITPEAINWEAHRAFFRGGSRGPEEN